MFRGMYYALRELSPKRQRSWRLEREFDSRFGIETAGNISLADLDILSPYRVYGVPYRATTELLFRQMMASLPIVFEDFTFVDYGSGLGRALLMASEYPFRAIRGVEFSPELNGKAAQNIQKYQSASQRCKSIESICADATEFPIPSGPVVLYFYNPFAEKVLSLVLENILRSLNAEPREAFIVYLNPIAAEAIERLDRFELIRSLPAYRIYRALLLPSTAHDRLTARL